MSSSVQSPASLHEHKYPGFAVYLYSFLLGIFSPSYKVSVGGTRGIMHGAADLAQSLAARMRFEARSAQTTATCQEQFAWMQNTRGQSPCQVAASLDAVCFNGDFTVSALPSGYSYDNPNQTNGTANPCTCSWASYNLLSACTTCQGISQETPSWSDYSFGCAGFLSNTFFPANITLPKGLAIPFWALMNASEWDGGTFSEQRANEINDEGKPDYVAGVTSPMPPPSPHRTNNNGAIIGGVIGGVVVILSMVFIAIWMIRHNRGSSTSNTKHRRPGHKYTLSDESNLVKHEGYESMHSYPISSPVINSSVHSFSALGSAVPGQTSSVLSSRPGGSLVAVPNQQPIPAIPAIPQTVTPFPYDAQPTAGHPDRKQSNGLQLTYGHPSSPPRDRSGSSGTAPRARITPPAYTPPDPSQPRHARKQLSAADMQDSFPSSRIGRTGVQYGHNPSASGGSGTNFTSAEPTHGRVLSGSSKDEKRSNTVLQYSGSDLA